MRKPWFGPKTLGYGIGPKSWQGWLATAIFAAGGIGGTRLGLPVLHAELPHPWNAIAAGAALLIWLSLFFVLVQATYGGES